VTELRDDIPEQTGMETVTETQAEEIIPDMPEIENPETAEVHLRQNQEEINEVELEEGVRSHTSSNFS